MTREIDGSMCHGAPTCRCGSRATKRIEGKFLVRRCSKCHSTYYYRLHDGVLVPLSYETARGIDEERASQ